MPFDSIADLPDRIKRRFPSAAAQRAFRGAFNAAWEGTCKDGGQQGNQEACAFAVATTAAQKVNKALDDGLDPEPIIAEEIRKAKGMPISTRMRVVKADDEKQILYSAVLVPDVEDAQEDIIKADEIEKAAHRFFREYTEGTAQLGLDHEITLDRDSAHLVESWITKVDESYESDEIPAGTWMVGWHIPDAELWKSAKSGARSGLSMEGSGVRTPL